MFLKDVLPKKHKWVFHAVPAETTRNSYVQN